VQCSQCHFENRERRSFAPECSLKLGEPASILEFSDDAYIYKEHGMKMCLVQTGSFIS
jgi:hypothetical protein